MYSRQRINSLAHWPDLKNLKRNAKPWEPSLLRCSKTMPTNCKAATSWLKERRIQTSLSLVRPPRAEDSRRDHNVGGLPDWMKMKLIEPLRWLFKDEVREVGRRLGLPEEMVEREPFPGPGLAVRVLGEVTPDRVRMTQEADWIFRSELKARGLNKGIWQSYAALLDVKSVGVMGDERTYQQPIVLRAVESEDAMTARSVSLPFEALEAIAARIVNEVQGVNRVFYDLTSKLSGKFYRT